MILIFALAQLLRRVPGNARFRKPFWAGTSPLTLPLTHAAMQRLLRFRTGCHGLPKDMAASLACLDIRGCASSVALVLAMRCTWSLSAQRWQICMANFQVFFSHIRRCSKSCGS